MAWGVLQAMPCTRGDMSKIADASMGYKLLMLYQLLMLDGRRHFLTDLMERFECSRQTIMRLVAEIEAVIGAHLTTGIENRRRWYQIRTIARSRLGLEHEELRYLAICRDLATPYLPEQIKNRIDRSIFDFSMLLADKDYAVRENLQSPKFAFFNKGKIDYTPHYAHIDKLLDAMEQRRICLVLYKAAGKSRGKEHKFAPSRFASMNNTLYILGADVLDDFKSTRHLSNFAVQRILDVAITDKEITFDIPETEYEMFGLPWHEPKTFAIVFKAGKPADYVRERIWADKQQLDELPDGSVRLTITTTSEQELMAWVRSFGDEVKAVEPEHKVL